MDAAVFEEMTDAELDEYNALVPQFNAALGKHLHGASITGVVRSQKVVNALMDLYSFEHWVVLVQASMDDRMTFSFEPNLPKPADNKPADYKSIPSGIRPVST